MPTLVRPLRCFLLDSARLMERPAYYESAFKFLASNGITEVLWHFTDDHGCQMHFESVAGIGSPHALTVSETKRLVKNARDLGITVIPELAALGHSKYITRLPQYRHLNEEESAYTGMCPVAPETRELLATLLRETMEVFDAPAVHVGMDEVAIGSHPLTEAALQSRTRSQIMADHIRFLHDVVVVRGGREMWMWGDQLLSSPELMETLPKDIVVCNWQYDATANRTTTQRLLDAGYDVVTASALLSFGQPLFPSTDCALANVRAMRSHRDLRSATTSARVRGEIVTTWIPQRSLSEAQWLGWQAAALILKDGPTADLGTAIRAFGESFYGLASTDDWLPAARSVLDDAPERAEWMATVKLDLNTLPKATLPLLASKAEHWAATASALTQLRADVRDHLRAFDTFALLVDVVAHVYDAAVRMHEDDDRPTFVRLLNRRRELIAACVETWDAERYADDPAKTVPVISYFRDEHLLLILGDGLDVLEQTVNRTASVGSPQVA